MVGKWEMNEECVKPEHSSFLRYTSFSLGVHLKSVHVGFVTEGCSSKLLCKAFCSKVISFHFPFPHNNFPHPDGHLTFLDHWAVLTSFAGKESHHPSSKNFLSQDVLYFSRSWGPYKSVTSFKNIWGKHCPQLIFSQTLSMSGTRVTP